MTARDEMIRALQALYVQVPESVTDDIGRRFADYEAYSQAENERLIDQFIEMLSTFGLHRPADKETGPWYRGECHPNCKACDMINAIRSQAATERGEPHAKS